MMVSRLASGQRSTETNSIEKIQGKTSKKSWNFKEYNSRIVSADKDWREKVLKLDQFYLGFVLQSIWL